MKKQLSLLMTIALLFTAGILKAQPPQGFNYQAVIRDGSGNLVVTGTVNIRFTILQTTAGGPEVYQETHLVSPNGYGQVTAIIGQGTQVSANPFTAINWNIDIYFLKVEADPAGGSNFVNLGAATQFQSVPYALSSGNCWSLNGNAGTNSFSNFIGTTDDQPLSFRTNNKEVMNVDTSGNLTVGRNMDRTILRVLGNRSGPNYSAVGLRLEASADGSPLGLDINSDVILAVNNTEYSRFRSKSISGGVNITSISHLKNPTSVMEDKIVFDQFGNTMLKSNNVSRITIDSTGKMNIGTKMMVASNGNVGISTTSPQDGLDIYGAFRVGGVIGNGFAFTPNGSGHLDITYKTGQSIFTPNILTLQYTGNVGIGTTTPVDKLSVVNPAGATTGALLVLGGTQYGLEVGTASAAYAATFNGSLYTTGTYNTSDERLKKNISTYSGALASIGQLNVKTYEFINEGLAGKMNFPKGEQIGIMADNIKALFPGLVKETELRDLSNTEGDASAREKLVFNAVNYTGLIPVLIKGMQEQQAEIEALKKEIDILKNK